LFEFAFFALLVWHEMASDKDKGGKMKGESSFELIVNLRRLWTGIEEILEEQAL